MHIDKLFFKYKLLKNTKTYVTDIGVFMVCQ